MESKITTETIRNAIRRAVRWNPISLLPAAGMDIIARQASDTTELGYTMCVIHVDTHWDSERFRVYNIQEWKYVEPFELIELSELL